MARTSPRGMVCWSRDEWSQVVWVITWQVRGWVGVDGPELMIPGDHRRLLTRLTWSSGWSDSQTVGRVEERGDCEEDQGTGGLLYICIAHGHLLRRVAEHAFVQCRRSVMPRPVSSSASSATILPASKSISSATLKSSHLTGGDRRSPAKWVANSNSMGGWTEKSRNVSLHPRIWSAVAGPFSNSHKCLRCARLTGSGNRCLTAKSGRQRSRSTAITQLDGDCPRGRAKPREAVPRREARSAER